MRSNGKIALHRLPMIWIYSRPFVGVSVGNMQERKSVPFSKRCRELAKECRVRALLFQNEKPRDEMFRLADDYDRKALQAEELEATLQTPLDESPSLIPEIAEAFVSRLRVNAIQSDQRVTNPGEIGSRERDGDHRDPDKIVSSRLVKRRRTRKISRQPKRQPTQR